jgi:HAD superfamily hydrolase (TIGR01509 family)
MESPMSDAPREVAAVFFDMDGTLIDSELNTEPAVVDVCRRFGIDEPELDYPSFHGRTWTTLVESITEVYPSLADVPDLAMQFHRRFHDLCAERPPPPIPGARETVLRLSESVPVAIVSSAFRESIAQTISQLDIAARVSCFVGAEDFGRSKPAPDCFLHAAQILDVDPARCIVFEDSIAGIEAARAAGMWAVAITHRSNDPERVRALADIAIDDYTLLDHGFFERALGGRGGASEL